MNKTNNKNPENDVLNISNDIKKKDVTEKTTGWGTITPVSYCVNKCEFYKKCYGNTSSCMKHDVEDVINTLSPIEVKFIKLKYGYYESGCTNEEAAQKLYVDLETVKEIETEAIQKLKNLSRSKILQKHVFTAFSFGDNFYSRLLSDVLESKVENEFHAETEVGVDFSIIYKEKCLHRMPEDVQAELNKKIEDYPQLAQYVKKIKGLNIFTLEHLLYTSPNVILECFDNDVEFFEMKSTIKEMGYKFKDDLSDYKTLAKELCQTIKNQSTYDEKISGLTIGVLLNLYKEGKSTYTQLLDYMVFAPKWRDVYTDEEKGDIDKILCQKKLIFKSSKIKNIYLTENYIDVISEELTEWLIENNYSVNNLMNNLKKENLKLSEAIHYINKTYPKFVIQTNSQILLNTKLEDLNLSNRSYSCLKRVGINTVSNIIERTEEEIQEIWNLDRRSAEEISEMIYSMGLSYKQGGSYSIYNPARNYAMIMEKRQKKKFFPNRKKF